MIPEKLLLVLLFLIYHFNHTIAQPEPLVLPVGLVRCFPTRPPATLPQLADCQAAINAIPNGNLHIGSVTKPLELHLPASVREHNYQPKPVFRSGGCYISIGIGPIYSNNGSPPQGLEKSALYFKVFPALREGAQYILRECLVKRRMGGWAVVQTDLYGQNRTYGVLLSAPPDSIPKTSGPLWYTDHVHVVDVHGKTI